MNTPLILETFIDKETDEQMCTIWSNGKKHVVPAPFHPYFYSMRSLEFDMTQDITEIKERVKLLSDLKEHNVYKYEVLNVDFIREINKSLARPGLDSHQKIVNAIFENHTPFIHRILIDKQDFVTQYPNTNDLVWYFFDIETLMSNYMDLKTITSIAYATNDRKVYSKQGDEREILEWFLDSIESVNPDIMCGYYMRDFDLVRIIERAKYHKLDYKRLARDRNVHYYKSERDRNVTMKIGGRVLFDLFDSVNADQTIYGIKNRRMKTVCEFFGIEGKDWVKVPMHNSANDVDEETLRQHNCDDIRRTFGLADIYKTNIITLSEMFNVPLDFIVSNTQATLAGIFMGRGLLNLNIRSDGMNQDRHPEIFRRAKAKGESNYEAALVGIYQPGLHKPLYKIDFAGFYPSLMAAFNLSPDTAKILGYKPYQKEFTSEVVGNKVVYYIPDKVIKKTIIIGVKQDVDGFLRKELRQIREERNKIKKAYKTASPEEKDILNSRQWALKVMQNIPSGLNGSAISRYGDIGTTIPTVGFGREILGDLKDHIDEEKPICIESDTDGLYLSEKPDMNEINKFLEDLIATKFNLKESAEISLDLDEYKAGYFIKQKNYILQNLNGDLMYHGAGMKSSRLPGIFDSAKDILCNALLSRETKDIKATINKLCDLDQYDIKEFTLRTTLHKKLSQYKPGALQRKLGDQAKSMGMPVEQETQLEYVKVKEGYRIIQAVNNISEIDKEYYINIISKLSTAIGLEQEFKTRSIRTLDNWW